MNTIKKRKSSYFTATDEFCGAGGTTTGAKQAGLEVKMAMNHWALAIETHNTNHQDVDHDCRDISASDPRRYPTTDFLLASPECTNHSLAKGQKRKHNGTGDLFDTSPEAPENVRSRATMWDVPRFTEYHHYEIIIVENVVDARRWVMWDAWLMAMHALGYLHKCVYLNSMFAHPTPQSRDRMYVVFWKKGNKAPDLDIRPAAFCIRCAKEVQAVQSWKRPDKQWGKYGKNGQYVYRCPHCIEEVVPYYYAAFNAIDWSIQAERIGDRAKPLKPRTLERIQYGLDKYGRQPLMINQRRNIGVARRVRGAIDDPLQTQTTEQNFSVIDPGFFQKNYGGNKSALNFGQPLGSITTSDSHSIISPALVQLGHGQAGPCRVSGAADPMPTQTTAQTVGIASPGFIAEMYGTSRAGSLEDALMCVTAGGVNHALIDTRAFLAYYYGTMNASGMDDPANTVTTVDRAGLVEAAKNLRIEDCTFRMLQPHEIQGAMAFPSDYIVLGTKREQIKQLGNAVTPPASRDLCSRCIESLL